MHRVVYDSIDPSPYVNPDAAVKEGELPLFYVK